MTEDQLIDVGMYRLRYPLANFEVVLDTRLSTLTFRTTEDGNNGGANNLPHVPQAIINLRLSSFPLFEEDVRRLSAKRSGNGEVPSKALLFYLDHMTHNRELPPHPVWREAFGDFGLLLMRYARQRPGPLFEEARDLALWLGALQAKSAWRLSFNTRLSFEHRYKLLTSMESSAGKESREDDDQIEVPETKERQLCWWSAMRRYELAQEWCESEFYNPVAHRALRDETIHYLQVLKDEPRQQDLRRFLNECGTDIETEVKKVLFNPSLPPPPYKRRPWRQALAKSNTPSGLVKDEVIRRAFVVWFLKRYDWWSAWKLVLSGPNRRRLWITLLSCGFLNLLALLLYTIQINEPSLHPYLPSPEHRTMWLWASQLMLQLSSLFLLLFLAPILFRLLMPRALFGSLTDLCHQSQFSDLRMFGYSMLIALGMMLLGAVFVGYTVTQFTQGPWKTLRRTVAMLCFLLLGSLYWAIALALPIKITLERDAFAFDCHCVIPIVVIGSSIAVLFGLLVELIWQDESLAEPIGEPL